MFLFSFLLSYLFCFGTSLSVDSTLSVVHSSDYTSYSIVLDNSTWLISGDTYFRNKKRKAKLEFPPKTYSYNGIDNFGVYNAIDIIWTDKYDNYTTFVNTFKEYPNNSDMIVMTQKFPQGLINPETDPLTFATAGLISSFPSFIVDSNNENVLEELGFIHFAGVMASGLLSQFGKWLNDKSSDLLFGGIEESGVIALYNKNMSKSLVISPLNNFMAFNIDIKRDLNNNTIPKQIQYGLLGNITNVPINYEISFIIVSRNSGINSCMKHWGNYLLKYYNRKYSDSWNKDYILNYLGYSTDNGAFYYYNTEIGKNYAQTIEDIKNYSIEMNIPYKYIQLDSWWYYHGSGGGVANWTSTPNIFPPGGPSGLELIYNKTGWKIQAHNRAFGLNTVYANNPVIPPSPGYNGKTFKFTWGKKTGLPLTYDFWDYLFSINTEWGLITYEQDWLSYTTQWVPLLLQNVTFGKQWLFDMNSAANKYDLNIQYCMSYPRHILTTLEFGIINRVTNARASEDYHPTTEQQWRLGISGLFLDSIGVAPSKDNFWSSTLPQFQPRLNDNRNISERRPRLQSVISTMSNGPVQISDQIGYSNVSLIMKCCNKDGLLLRPTRSITGIDRYFASHSWPNENGNPKGEVYSVYSEISSGDSNNIWIYSYVIGALLLDDFSLTINDISHHFENSNSNINTFLAYENKTPNKLIKFDINNPIIINKCNEINFSYYSIIPINLNISNNWYLQGEINKWISVSSQRFKYININNNGNINIKMNGINNEIVSIGFVNYNLMNNTIINCKFDESLIITINCNSSNNQQLICQCLNY